MEVTNNVRITHAIHPYNNAILHDSQFRLFPASLSIKPIATSY